MATKRDKLGQTTLNVSRTVVVILSNFRIVCQQNNLASVKITVLGGNLRNVDARGCRLVVRQLTEYV